jgi:hypothetical protein
LVSSSGLLGVRSYQLRELKKNLYTGYLA